MFVYIFMLLQNKYHYHLDKHCNPHHHPVGMVHHGQLWLRGNHKLTSIITYTYILLYTTKLQYTYQTSNPVGVGQHCHCQGS